ncbi:GTPase family protein [Floridanema evergladense]|uniref:GTPase family protein n=1 Tax=Floridaenema evergladense BLCC-F167 TaxID=3153639 RepID=A0ABV4WGW9_9CYAN
MLKSDTLTVLFFGKTGVGKSSTLNSLFGLNWATDDAIACTKAPQFTYLDRSHYLDLPYQQVRLVDMPGIGESVTDDEKYMPFYEEWIPQTHSLVWVTQADTRAYKRDEIFLTKLMPLFQPSLFLTVALNKIDCLGVDEGEKAFNFETGEPSEAQLRQIPEKVDDVYGIFKSVINGKVIFEKSQIIPYTSIHQWGLQNLKNKVFQRN